MNMADLIDVLEEKVVYGPPGEPAGSVDIARISTDSRSVKPGDLFVALRGTASDGHDFVADAVRARAAAVVTDRPMTEVSGEGILNVVVGDTAKALASLAARYYGDPADAMFLCGITGTNGKTSTAHMYRSIIETSGWGCMGIVGTLGHGVGGELEKTTHTTPGPLELHSRFRAMLDRGCNGVVMEVSSHAVRQHRTWGLDFEIGILTNVTHDHLDYHKTIEDYRAAKKEFCDSLVAAGRRKPAGTLVYSADDPVARRIGREFSGAKLAVTVGGRGRPKVKHAVRVAEVSATLEGTAFTLHIEGAHPVRVNMRLLGTFCAVNAALAAGGAHATGIPVDAVKRGLEALDRIPGRFEALGGGGKPVVIIDYSHTPDSMERVLKTCRTLGPGRLVTVFGCGGDRDRSKRPLMGRVAQSLSDFVYVTMDNPRTEPIEVIMEDIVSGMDRDAGNFRIHPDREEAIVEAVRGADAGDVVALLGKGVENCQIVGTDRLPFSDRGAAEGALGQWPGC
jgi:UDP-N-acetylmuramoyl-L-alanyl-D-glutamate--2,6-diaminopimelate ligase